MILPYHLYTEFSVDRQNLGFPCPFSSISAFRTDEEKAEW